MKTSVAIFKGDHRGQPATVTFCSAMGGGWKVVMAVAGKMVKAHTSKNVKPCMTHAGYLLDEHFPHRLDKAPGRRPRKQSAHQASVVESTFVEVKTGVRLKVVS